MVTNFFKGRLVLRRNGSITRPNSVRDLFGYAPGAALSVVEMGRISTWVNRQRAVPMARLNEVRVRDQVRTAKRGEGEQQ